MYGKDGLPAILPPNLILRPSIRGDGSQEDYFRQSRRGRKQQKYAGIQSLNRQESDCSPTYAQSSTTPRSLRSVRSALTGRSTMTPRSIGSASVNSTVRRKDVRDMFDKYGISRPENWLSEENSEDGMTKKQLAAATKTLGYRICHSCRRRLPTGKDCPECGHESCIKCTDEMPLEGSSIHDATKPLAVRYPQAINKKPSQPSVVEQIGIINSQHKPRLHRTKAFTPDLLVGPSASATMKAGPPAKPNVVTEGRGLSRPIVSNTLKNNPFVKADNVQKGLASTPEVLPQHAWARRPTELSDCLPQRHMDRSASDSTSPEECENLSCRDSQAGIRHSVRCTSRRKALRQLATPDWIADRYVHESAKHNQHVPLQDPLQSKIDQLYHHSDDLYRSQHIIEHLAAGTRALGDPLTNKSPDPLTQEKDSGASTEVDSRLHSLAVDQRELAEQPT